MDRVAEMEAEARPAIGALIHRLGEELQRLLRAEIAVYRAEAGRRALSAGWATGLLIGALTLVQGALIALLVGLVMLLAPSIGMGWAIVAVVAAALLTGALLAWLGVRQIDTMIDPDKP